MNISDIKGIVLDKEQLKKHLENIASDHTLNSKSEKQTYPVPEMERNFEYITKVYETLNSHLKLGINIHQAGEWLLDNYYVIEETVKEVRKNLTLKKYIDFTGIASGKYKGYARSYVIASEIVNLTDGNFKAKDLEEYLDSYQNKKTLNMEEIWDINLFFKIALIDRIKDVCFRIYISQMQKIKVENIIERLVENKSKDELKFKLPTHQYTKKIQEHSENKYSFIEYMSYKLKKYGKKGIPFLNILEEEISKQGLSLPDVIKKEHFDIALKKVSIGNSIKSIHLLQRMNFLEIFERINGVEEILKKDPSGIYENMDYKTKEYYRNRIKEISKKTKISEIYIAKKIVLLAREKSGKEGHIGYYIIQDGIKDLYESLGLKKQNIKRVINKKINLYIFGTLFISMIVSVIIGKILYNNTLNILLSIIEVILIFIPVSEMVIKITQNILSKCVKPKLIPKIDFSKGIPEENTTMVVIPGVISNPQKAKELADNLEVFYLANKSENIYFTVLGDCTAGNKEIEKNDEKIKSVGIEEVQRLNKKYPKDGMPRFNFIYRKRIWNKNEGCFLGWERKRGLLTELNEYLISKNANTIKQNTFLVNTIEDFRSKNRDLDFKIKYVITLDSDTKLTLNSGIEMIEAMAHPLNKPEIDEKKNVVISGFGIMQPRVGIELEESAKSMFTEIFAGDGRSRFIYKCNFRYISR